MLLKNKKYFQKLSKFTHSFFSVKNTENKKILEKKTHSKKINIVNISTKVCQLLRCFNVKYCGILLPIEEFYTNGLDINDIILIVKSFETVGIKFIIVNIKTNKFSIPKKKHDLKLINNSNHTWLHNLSYLIKNTNTPVFVSNNSKLTPELIISTKRCGISGVLQISRTYSKEKKETFARCN